MEGLDEKFRRLCSEEGVQTLEHAIRVARANFLSRSQMVRDEPFPNIWGLNVLKA